METEEHILENAGEELVGKRIAILWKGTEDGDQWYSGEIVSFQDDQHHVLYDDETEDDYDLTTVTCRIDGVEYNQLDSDEESESDEDLLASIGGSAALTAGDTQPAETPVSEDTQPPKKRELPPRIGAIGRQATDSVLLASPANSRSKLAPMKRQATVRLPKQRMLAAEVDTREWQPYDRQQTAMVAEREESPSPVENAPEHGEGKGDDTQPLPSAEGKGDDTQPPPSPQPAQPSDPELRQAAADAAKASDRLRMAELVEAKAAPGPEFDYTVFEAGEEPVVEVPTVEELGGEPKDQAVLGDQVPQPPESQRVQEIEELKQEVQGVRIQDYTQALAAAAKPEEVVIAALTVEEAEEAERKLEEQRLAHAQKQAEEFHMRQRHVALRETRARKRLLEAEAEARDRVKRREAQAMERSQVREHSIRRLFRKAEAQLKESLGRQQAVVEERYGRLLEEGRAGARRLRVQWRKLPQPVELHMLRLRGAKDRVPSGRFVMLVTLYDRIGGQPLRWGKLRLGAGAGAGRPSCTQPVYHRGRFYDADLSFKQSVFSLGPAEPETTPSMCYVIELFMLRNRRSPVDQVVGWTVLPYADDTLRPVQGHFKLPMLRGEVDFDIDKYQRLEAAVATDLDKWLGNLYMEVRRLPREAALDHVGKAKGKPGNAARPGEFDVELAYTSELLRLPNSATTAAAAAGGGGDDDSDGWGSDYSDGAGDPELLTGPARKRLDRLRDRSERLAKEKAALRRGKVGYGASRKGYSMLPASSSTSRRGSGSGSHMPTLSEQPSQKSEMTRGTHRKIARPAFAFLAGGEEESKGTDGGPGGGEGGLSLGTSSKRPPKLGASARLMASSRRSSLSSRLRTRSKRSDSNRGDATSRDKEKGAEEVDAEAFEYAVKRQETLGLQRGTVSETAAKLRHLKHSILADLSFHSVFSFELWLQIFLFVVAVWLRIYVHYVGEWLFLTAMRVPLYTFEPRWYTMALQYVPTLLTMETELGAIILGPLTNVLVFFALVFVSWLFVRTVGHVPEISSRFVAVYGVATVFDSLLIFIFDLIAGHFNCSAVPACAGGSAPCDCIEGDAFKLFVRFNREEGSGMVGLFLTVFVYMAVALVAAMLMYVFLLHVHLDGRMIDVYRRLHATEGSFFMPQDMEVSPDELRWIVAKARRWRGPKGTKRRVAVCDYTLTDPWDARFKEATTHLIIYHSDLSGQRELYRHFLRMPSGAALELFGDLTKQFGTEFGALQQLLINRDGEDGAGARPEMRFFTDNTDDLALLE